MFAPVLSGEMLNRNKRTDAEKQNVSEFPQFHSQTQNSSMLARDSANVKWDGYFVHSSAFFWFGSGSQDSTVGIMLELAFHSL